MLTILLLNHIKTHKEKVNVFTNTTVINNMTDSSFQHIAQHKTLYVLRHYLHQD